jgi:hypothetical protein
VVGGVGGIAIISLAVFFWIRRRRQKKLKDVPDPGGRVGNAKSHLTEYKDVQPFSFATHPSDIPPTSPAALSYTSTPHPLSH